MKLYFQNSQGVEREIADCSNLDDIYNSIDKFCKERNFSILYTRTWTNDDAIIIDVGSHTEFFKIR